MFLLSQRRFMMRPMRDKALRAIERYAEGGTIGEAVAAQGINNLAFYRTKDAHPDLAELYEQVQRFRADMMYDEAYLISTDDSLSPATARERAAIRMKIAQAYDRKRFGDKVAIDVTTVDLTSALAEARARSIVRPLCDLTPAIEAEYTALPPHSASEATDKQSGDSSSSPPAPTVSDVFE